MNCLGVEVYRANVGVSDFVVDLGVELLDGVWCGDWL